MLTFKEYLLVEKAGYPSWVKATAVMLTMRIRNIETQIKNEKDIDKKMNLLSRQLKIISYLNTLGISVDVNDKTLVKTD